MHPDLRNSPKLLLSLAAVYFLWGSSFLFSKIAVTHLPPALLSCVRFTIAGTLLALLARYWFGARWPNSFAELRTGLILGVAMVLASNGLNIWALRFIPTNQSALLNSTAAFWIAGLGVFGPRGHPLTRRAVFGLVIGFIGTALMLVPDGTLSRTSALAQIAALAGTLAWSLGTLYYRSLDTRLNPLMLTSMQMLFGGMMLLAVALWSGETARWSMNAPGLVALAYLTLCSSCLAFTAYSYLMRHATPTLIGTYGYVNPAIAAFLGWQFLDERLSRVQLIGMVVIIVGVALLTMPGGSVLDPKTLAEPKTQ